MRKLYSQEAEQGVVGGLMIDPNSFDKIDGLLSESMFSDNGLRIVFNTVLVLHEIGKPVDLITVSEYLESHNVEMFNMVGGIPWLADLIQNTPSSANIVAYAETVSRFAKERGLYNATTEAQQILMADGLSTDERFQEAEAVLTAAWEDESKTDNTIGMTEAVRDYLRTLEHRFEHPGIYGLKTGFKVVDERLNGVNGGALFVVAARPSMGKTTYAMNIAANVAIKGSKVYVSSLEMPRNELVQRLMAYVGKIPLSLLKDAQVLAHEDHMHKLTPAVKQLAEASIRIDDQPSLDVNELRTRCRREKRSNGLDLIIVDYLQLLTDRTCSGRFDEVSSVSRKLKALAKELDCPVIALSQLSRKCEERTDKRPMMSDLRESGQIEQDADIIQFLYRDDVYDESSPRKGIAEIITAKFRDGEKGTDCMAFVGAQNMFAELTHQPQPIQPKPKRGTGFNG